jgi:hypothetical protein
MKRLAQSTQEMHRAGKWEEAPHDLTPAQVSALIAAQRKAGELGLTKLRHWKGGRYGMMPTQVSALINAQSKRVVRSDEVKALPVGPCIATGSNHRNNRMRRAKEKSAHMK